MSAPVSSDDILALFFTLLQGDADFIKALEEQGGDIRILEREWQFSLPAFFSVIQLVYPHFRQLDYPAFRKLLFASPVNQYLKDAGWQVNLKENKGKTDLNIYCLTRL